MSDEMHVVLLLDVVAENPIDEAMVRQRLPGEAPDPLVLRLTDFGAKRCSTGTPDNWLPVMSAIDRMLRAARGPEQHAQCRYWVAGRAGLPAFFYLGYRLSKKAVVTLVNRRDIGPVDVLPLDTASLTMAVPQPYFARSPWPRRPSHSEAPLGLVVSSRIGVSAEQVEGVMSRRGTAPAAIVEAQASGVLDAASLGSALHELDEQIAGIRTWYPRCSSLSVFMAGPATLAFLAGRAINPHIFPDVQLFQYRDGNYVLAHEVTSQQSIATVVVGRRDDHEFGFVYETTSRRKKHTILFLASNPSSTSRLALGEEAHDIQHELARSQHRDRFELRPQLAPRAREIRRHLQTFKPSVVHFSGHGDTDGLVFHHDDGTFRIVSPEDLGEIFRIAQTTGASVKVVVLNACFSEPHASALLEHVDCVVGMPGPVLDDAARSFAVGFYGALGDRLSVQDAYDAGCLEMRLEGAQPCGDQGHSARDIGLDDAVDPGDGTRARPRLLVRPGVDAGALVLAAGSD